MMKEKSLHIIKSQGDITPLLSYLSDYTVYLNLPCILTLTKLLRIGMPYLYCEGLKTFPIRLLHVWDSEGFVYLRIQNLQSGRVHEISRILQDDIEYCLWKVASLDYLMNLSNENIDI